MSPSNLLLDAAVAMADADMARLAREYMAGRLGDPEGYYDVCDWTGERQDLCEPLEPWEEAILLTKDMEQCWRERFGFEMFDVDHLRSRLSLACPAHWRSGSTLSAEEKRDLVESFATAEEYEKEMCNVEPAPGCLVPRISDTTRQTLRHQHHAVHEALEEKRLAALKKQAEQQKRRETRAQEQLFFDSGTREEWDDGQDDHEEWDHEHSFGGGETARHVEVDQGSRADAPKAIDDIPQEAQGTAQQRREFVRSFDSADAYVQAAAGENPTRSERKKLLERYRKAHLDLSSRRSRDRDYDRHRRSRSAARARTLQNAKAKFKAAEGGAAAGRRSSRKYISSAQGAARAKARSNVLAAGRRERAAAKKKKRKLNHLHFRMRMRLCGEKEYGFGRAFDIPSDQVEAVYHL